MLNTKIFADKKPVVLVVLDGWGNMVESDSNAITKANTPNFDSLKSQFPNSQLVASGSAVGLPDRQMGNSEVGHAHLGAGRVIDSDLVRISKAAEVNFEDNQVICEAIAQALKRDSALHLNLLLSDGGVHSHDGHLLGVLRLAATKGLTKVFIHADLDGRDTPPCSALEYIAQLERAMSEIGVGSIATVGGRYYGMDRDKNWERVETAYQAKVLGQGPRAENAATAVMAGYASSIDDEFIQPTIIVEEGMIQDEDVVFFLNFRADRAKEMTAALTQDDDIFYAQGKTAALIKDGDSLRRFDRGSRLANLHFVSMTDYGVTPSSDTPIHVAFGQVIPQQTLGEIVSNAGLNQLRAAETEKYAHVTYFFNGGAETKFPCEDRVLVSSPKVKTYDLQPEMSAQALTDAILKQLEQVAYALMVINYANPDMVGHTGNLEAAIKAVEAVDRELGRIWAMVQKLGGVLVVTADHGNAEQMLSADGEKHTAHTTNMVPIIIADSSQVQNYTLADGSLPDVAPTILQLMGLEQPEVMTGNPLIVEK